MTDARDDEKPIPLDFDVAIEVSKAIYAIFEQHKLNVTEALGSLAWTVAYLLRDKIGTDPDCFAEGMRKFDHICVAIYAQLCKKGVFKEAPMKTFVESMGKNITDIMPAMTQAEMEDCQFVVCVLWPEGEPPMFPDNLARDCVECGKRVQVRPASPAKLKPVCFECLQGMIGDDDTVQIRSSPNAVEDIREWHKRRQH